VIAINHNGDCWLDGLPQETRANTNIANLIKLWHSKKILSACERPSN